jgi:hypothetical protein
MLLRLTHGLESSGSGPKLSRRTVSAFGRVRCSGDRKRE